MSAPNNQISSLVVRWCMTARQSPMAQYVFQADGDFTALDSTLQYARQKNLSCGPLDGDNPIACAPGQCAVGKWHTIRSEHYHRLAGIIVSDNWRTGPCTLVEFRRNA